MLFFGDLNKAVLESFWDASLSFVLIYKTWLHNYRQMAGVGLELQFSLSQKCILKSSSKCFSCANFKTQNRRANEETGRKVDDTRDNTLGHCVQYVSCETRIEATLQ